MTTKEVKQDRKLLRATYPKLYEHLLEKLGSYNIHAYDVQMTSRKIDASVEIQVRFGERFSQQLTQAFSENAVHELGDVFNDFCENVQQTCRETLISDYFKMVKP